GVGFASLDKKIEIARDGGNPVPMTMEGCLVRMADTISYIGRDIEDAISLGILSRKSIPHNVKSLLGDTNGKIVYTLVEDLITNSGPDAIAYSSRVFSALEKLKTFNYKNIYLNPKVKYESKKIMTIYELVFKRLVSDIKTLNKDSYVFTDFLDRMNDNYTKAHKAEEIARDYIASLTDSRFLALFYHMFIPRMFG
ncbi:MAG: phosphohydrolase, partial [Deltaproteobacteria bacterium]|nr:phosphohydrolase [Deltaproteobacteria bacterium]